MLSVLRAESPARGERAQKYGNRGRPVTRSSGGGFPDNWDSLEEGIVREIAQWLPRADARRARLACRAWRGALAGLSTSAATPAEASTVTRWRTQLDSMVASLPCLRELTVCSKLSEVGGQQLAALAGVAQLRVLRIPHGHSLRDRSVQAIAQLTQLQELQILGANALTGRALCALSMLGASLRVLDLRGCAKVSFAELRQAWRAVCGAYATAAAAGAARARRTRGSSSGGGGGALGGGARAGAARGGSSGGAGASLQQLLPGGAEVLQRQRAAGLGRVSRGPFGARDRLLIGGGRHTRSSGGCSSGSGAAARGHRRGSDGGGAAGRAGGDGRVFAQKRRNSTGCFAGRRSGSGGGKSSRSSSGGGGWQHAAGRRGGRATADDAVDDAAAHASGPEAGEQADGSRPRGAARVAALKAGARLPRQLSGGAMATAATAAQHARTQGCIFKQQQQQHAAAPPAGAIGAAAAAAPASAPAPAHSDCATAAGGGPGRQPANLAAAYASIAVAKQATSVAALYAAAAGPGALSLAPPGLGAAAAAPAGVCKQRSTVQAALLALLRAEERSSGGGWPRRGRSSGGGAHLESITELGADAGGGGGSNGGGGGGGAGGAGGEARSAAPAVPAVGRAAALPMPFPHLHTLAFSIGGGEGGGRGGEGGSGGGGGGAAASPAAELVAVAAIGSLTSLEIARCQQVPNDALACLSSLSRLSSLKLSGLWSASDRGLEAIAALTGLTSLSLHNPMRATGRGLAALASLTRLEALVLAIGQDLGPGVVSRLALALPALRALELSYPGFDDSCCEALAGDARKRALLASLKLHDAPALTARGLAALRRMPALASLALDACGGVASGALLGQGALAPGLRSLALRLADFSNMFAGGVLERPPCAASLVTLDLSGCADLADRELRKVAGFLPNLEELTLAGCAAVTDAGLSSLTSLRALRALGAGGTRAAGAFAEPLAALPGLTHLSLRGCGALTEPAVRLLLPLLAGLQDLDLSECRAVTDVGVLALAGSLASLGRLNIQGCKGVSRQVLPFVPHWLRLQHSLA